MRDSSPRSARTRARASVLAIVAVDVVAGCADSGPSDLDTPEVRWPDGEPTGDFEDDPAVVALREAFVRDAVAWNPLDFSHPDQVIRWGLPIDAVDGSIALADHADGRIAGGLDDPDEWTMFGARPMEILDMDTRDEARVVVACLDREFVQRNLVTSPNEEHPNSVRQYSVEIFPDGATTIASIRIDDDFDNELFAQCHETDPPRRHSTRSRKCSAETGTM